MLSLLSILIGLVLGFFHALLASWMWGQFVVPTFGAPELSVPIAWGCIMTISVIKGFRMSDIELDYMIEHVKDNDLVAKRLAARTVVGIAFLLLGWFFAWALTFFV